MKEQFQKIKKNSQINIFDKKTGKGWNADKRTVISQMIEICEDYLKKGYILSLRQLYYQMVKANYIPNIDIVYKKLSSVKGEAFYGGEIDWEAIEDRGRVPHQAGFDSDIKGALKYAAKYYRLDRQIGQTNSVEVWTEKDAISSILKRITNRYGIRLCVNKGYTSDTAIYAAYVRFLESIANGQTITILYFGDHDPSGLDMVRDIRERLLFMFENGERLDTEMYDRIVDWARSDAGHDFYDSVEFEDEYFNLKDIEGNRCFNYRKAYFENQFKIIQIGLTMKQIKQYDLPPNPAKLTDPRAKSYIAKFGQVSWEVDALSPEIIEDIVNTNIQSNIDFDQYNLIIQKEQNERDEILDIVSKL